MLCPDISEFWQRYLEQGDPQAARHLQYCAACRREVERATQLPYALSQLPALDTPSDLPERMQTLAEATSGQTLACAEAQSLLDAWREGGLDARRAFLMEDHLLCCEACAVELERADQLATALHSNPAYEPPAAIAERIAAARVPWWQRLLPDCRPAWGRLAPVVGGLAAAAAVMMALLLRAPLAPNVAVVPWKDNTRVAAQPLVATLPAAPAPQPGDKARNIIATAPARQADIATNPLEYIRPALSRHQRAPFTPPPAKTVASKPPAPSSPTPQPGASRPKPAQGHATQGRVPDIDHYVKPPTPAPVVAMTVSPREALLNAKRDQELAESEEALSTVPADLKKFAALPSAARPDVVEVKPAAVVEKAGAADEDWRTQWRDEFRQDHRGAAVQPPPIKRNAQETYPTEYLPVLH